MDAVDSMAKRLDGTFLGTAGGGDDTTAAPLAPMAMRPPTMLMQPLTSAAAASVAGQQAPIAPPPAHGLWARLRAWWHDTFGGDEYTPPHPAARHPQVNFGGPAHMAGYHAHFGGPAPLQAHPYYHATDAVAPIVAGEGLGVTYDTRLRG